jgi:hypothetical protein
MCATDLISVALGERRKIIMAIDDLEHRDSRPHLAVNREVTDSVVSVDCDFLICFDLRIHLSFPHINA